MGRLAGKVAIVTGAASGIGAGTAVVFAEHGARLVLVDRDGEGLEKQRQGLREQGADVAAYQTDVAVRAGIEHVVALALDAFGQIDTVVNNARIMSHGDLLAFDESTWNNVALFLASDEASAVTGSALFVDGAASAAIGSA